MGTSVLTQDYNITHTDRLTPYRSVGQYSTHDKTSKHSQIYQKTSDSILTQTTVRQQVTTSFLEPWVVIYYIHTY